MDFSSRRRGMRQSLTTPRILLSASREPFLGEAIKLCAKRSPSNQGSVVASVVSRTSACCKRSASDLSDSRCAGSVEKIQELAAGQTPSTRYPSRVGEFRSVRANI